MRIRSASDRRQRLPGYVQIETEEGIVDASRVCAIGEFKTAAGRDLNSETGGVNI